MRFLAGLGIAIGIVLAAAWVIAALEKFLDEIDNVGRDKR